MKSFLSGGNYMNRRIIKILLIMVFVLLVACNKRENDGNTFDINSLQTISDLAVLECKFNNVAKINQPKGSGILHFGETDRKIFMEYVGKVRIGVDIAEVIDKYNKESKTITIPKAKIISISDNPYTYKKYISKDGFINKNVISDEEFKNAISESKEKMKSVVEGNNSLMKRAQVLAESQIKYFIKTLGDFEITFVRE